MRYTSFLLMLVVFGCSLDAEPPPPNEWALINGAIYTVNAQQPWAEALHLVDGEIAWVGTTAEVQARASDQAEVLDLNGAMVMPGLHDVHTHPLEARSPFSGTCLLDSDEGDAEQFIAVLRNCAPNQIGSDWVLGSGHSVFTLLEADRPPVEILDEAIPDRPAAIMEETSHSVWVNSKALEATRLYTADDPPGGVIVRDPATDAPTGVLFDAAGDLVFDSAWPPSPEVRDLNYDGLLEALAELNAHGITSVAEGRTYWRRDFQEAWLRAEAEGTLTVRARLSLGAYPSQPDATQLPALRALYRNDPNALVRISEIKVYADGILINTTAAMLEPYLKTLGDIPSQVGLNYFDQDRLTTYIRELAPLGFDVHIHAIGDRGVREALNAIEAGQQPGQRHRLTHLEVVHADDYPRFAQLDVTADMQVAGDFAQPEHWSENAPLIGDRAMPLIPLRDLHEAGARITLSSDWDVSDLNPFLGMQRALTRAPQHLPALADAIAAYTINAAYALRQEDRVGSLEVGKRADLIVLDRNLFETPIGDLAATRVTLTMLDGQIVYED
ncbi:MAG: amidohydrolase [Rhodothermales bacterium]